MLESVSLHEPAQIAIIILLVATVAAVVVRKLQ